MLSPIVYCPVCDVITEGYLKAHYCEGNFLLGYLEESYVDMLEREVSVSKASLAWSRQVVDRQQKSINKLEDQAAWLSVYAQMTGVTVKDIKRETARLTKKYKRKMKRE